MLISLFSWIYKHVSKPIFFHIDPETVHIIVSHQAELIGKFELLNKLIARLFAGKSPVLKQKISGITFESPIGLAAGFDYEAKCVKILPSLGFGFNTVGTITNLQYEGNPKPRLGRLPKSKSLMVYKGFKNRGAGWTGDKLKDQTFKAPLGISIGKSNRPEVDTQEKAVKDIIQAFKTFEKSRVKNSYYELNISCPNLFGSVTFYPPENLDDLLTAVDKLKIKKPIFIKMPISETDHATKNILDVILRHKIAGVIIGNLQKDRKNSALDKAEVSKFKHGNFSGLPTQKRSDELIKLTYNHTQGKLLIIGCGGVFSAEDAYRKIKLGASLVQLITGLIYEGPLLVAKINQELPVLLKDEGYNHISEAIGSGNRG